MPNENDPGRDETKRFIQRNAPRFNGRGEFVLMQVKKWQTPDTDDTDRAPIYARVVNISEGGMRLEIGLEKNQELSDLFGWPPHIADQLDLILTGPSLPKPVHVEGEIVGLDTNDARTECWLSLKFIHLNEHLQDVIKIGLLRLNLSHEPPDDES